MKCGIAHLVEAEQVPCQYEHRDRERSANRGFSAEYREARARRCAEREADRDERCGQPRHLLLEYEHRHSHDHERGRDDDLDRIGSDQIEAEPIQREEQQQPHAGLNRTTVDADREQNEPSRQG